MAPKAAAEPPAAAAPPAELSGTDAEREEVRAWLAEHKVAEMMETVLKTTITARPADVASFMAAELRKIAPRADKPVCFFVLGGPGAGKGTQCAKIVETFGYTHLSAGDLLRAERESGSEQGEMIQGYITEGKIVPVEVTIKLIMKAVEENGGTRFLIDGFPRNTNNLSGWQQVAGDAITLAGVLCYDVSEEVLQARLLKRGETSGRADDNMESIQKRFVTFKSESLPVVQYYEHQGLCTRLDGSKSVEEVWAATKAFVEKMEANLK